MSKEARMFLACVELSPRHFPANRDRVLQLQFNDVQTARIWAEQEAARRADATGNVALFQIDGPFMTLIWEGHPAEDRIPIESDDSVAFAEDTLLPRG
jgi:hypothetical protein